MKIQIVGMGIVGEATAHFAKYIGHEVFGYDTKHKTGPDFVSVPRPITDPDITFICVPEAYVVEVIASLRNNHVAGLYVVRSTTKPGTIQSLTRKHSHVCHNPEFLREVFHLEDALNPPFILVGACCQKHADLVTSFYSEITKTQIVDTIVATPTESEMCKLLLNNYLAMLVTFWCEADEICSAFKLDTGKMAWILRNDKRVSPYGFTPYGQGFDGKCLPKDVRQLIDASHAVGLTLEVFEAMENYNNSLRKRLNKSQEE